VSILVRTGQAEDWSSLWPLLQGMGKTESEAEVARRVAAARRQVEHFLPVATSQGAVVGYAWAQHHSPHLRSGTSVVRLHDLFVAPPWRRHGAGSALFDAVARWAARRGATWLQWQASADALSFYARRGLQGDPCPDPEHPFFEIDLRQQAKGRASLPFDAPSA
jgi:GNAT superfamily N-acetyltransferase